MQKPNNFDNVSTGDFTPIELGGHYMTIKQVSETKSKSGKDMIVVLFDFAKEDKQSGYFMESFKNDIRPEKKWPYSGTQYIVTEDKDGNCSRSFKSFINAVEKSNNGFSTTWGEAFAAQFKNKRIGGVFGIVEDEYNGKTTKKHQLRWFCNWDKVESAREPEPKLLPNSNRTVSAPQTDADGFMAFPADADEEIPF
jgi:hypothetical protein